ncbi:MAG: methionine synthase, partial [Sporomusaceae bacterium]|nr:methionine synthase [Sporomusaceae bacterium]
MPVYNPALKPLNLREIKRYSGLDQYADFPSHLLDQACTESYILAEPEATWQIYDYNASSATIMGTQPLILQSAKVIHYLSQALKVAVMALTIGPKLEKKVSDYFSDGEYTSGLLLDAAGTAAVEVAADQVCEFIKKQAAQQG